MLGPTRPAPARPPRPVAPLRRQPPGRVVPVAVLGIAVSQQVDHASYPTAQEVSVVRAYPQGLCSPFREPPPPLPPSRSARFRSEFDAHAWHPTPTTAPWQWQLQGKIDTGVRPMSTRSTASKRGERRASAAPAGPEGRSATSTSAAGRATGRTPAVPEVGDRPSATKASRTSAGSTSAAFISSPPLERRFEICARKGFDAVEPDNIAGLDKQHRLPDRRGGPAALQPLGRPAGPRDAGCRWR